MWFRKKEKYQYPRSDINIGHCTSHDFIQMLKSGHFNKWSVSEVQLAILEILSREINNANAYTDHLFANEIQMYKDLKKEK